MEATGVDAGADSNNPEQPRRQIRGRGYLAGLASAGYTKISVDEIIALKQKGVEPQYIADMLSAELGVPTVDQ